MTIRRLKTIEERVFFIQFLSVTPLDFFKLLFICLKYFLKPFFSKFEDQSPLANSVVGFCHLQKNEIGHLVEGFA